MKITVHEPQRQKLNFPTLYEAVRYIATSFNSTNHALTSQGVMFTDSPGDPVAFLNVKPATPGNLRMLKLFFRGED